MADYKVTKFIATLRPYLIASNPGREELPKNMTELKSYLSRSSLSRRTIRAIVATLTPGDDLRAALDAWDLEKSGVIASQNYAEPASGKGLTRQKKRNEVEKALKASAKTPQGITLRESPSQIALRFGVSRQWVCNVKKQMEEREAELIEVLLKKEGEEDS